MLARLETAYLGLLRVVILIAATLALIVAALGLVSAVPSLLRKAGLTQENQVGGGNLSDFVAEKKLAGTAVSSSGDQKIPDRFVLPDVTASAKTLFEYTKGAGGIKLADWERGIEATGDDIGIGEQVAYFASLKSLTDQLAASKGKPLSVDRVYELVTWNKSRFTSSLDAKMAQELADASKFYTTMIVAGGAFLFFVLIVFVFLFVKIERSLRVVRTVRADEAHD